MGNIKQIIIKNQTYYFFNDMINIEDFDSNLLKLDKKSYKNICIYHIVYITMKKTDDCKYYKYISICIYIYIYYIYIYIHIYCVICLYLMIGKVIGHIEILKKK